MSLKTAKGDTEPGLTPEVLVQRLRRAEGQPASRADAAAEALQVDLQAFVEADEKVALLVVAQEQVLGVRAGDLPPQMTRLFDREHRRMIHRLGPESQFGEKSEQLVG